MNVYIHSLKSLRNVEVAMNSDNYCKCNLNIWTLKKQTYRLQCAFNNVNKSNVIPLHDLLQDWWFSKSITQPTLPSRKDLASEQT